MDVAKFHSISPGKLIPIRDGEHAFIPNSLPPEWEFSAELWPLLVEAQNRLGILEGIGRNLPNPSILLRPLGDREAIRSSRLEGTYASPKELLLFEMEPREAASETDRLNDWLEVLNYVRALNLGVNSTLPISIRLIKELHKVLLNRVRGTNRDPGNFRKIQVAIGSDKRFIPPPPDQVLNCILPLEKYIHLSNTPYDPLVDCFLVHYQFETTHPFIDGNGRVGRLLLALMIKEKCGLSKPWLFLSEYFERHRTEYAQRLFEISTSAHWKEWVEFCLKGTVQQANDTIERCHRLLQIREEFKERIIAVKGGSVRLNQIAEDIFHSPYLRVKDLPQRLNVTYPTAKADVDRLVGVGILQEVEDTAVKTFYAPEVFDIAYDDIEEAETDTSA